MSRLPLLLSAYLQSGESVELSLEGRYNSLNVLWNKRQQRKGLLALTNQRLIFFCLTSEGEQLETMPFERIDWLDWNQRALRSQLSFEASGNPCELSCWRWEDVARFGYSLRQRIRQASSEN